MTYGLKALKPNGGVMFTTESTTWNLVDVLHFERNGEITKTYPGIRFFETLISMVFVDPTPIDRRAFAPICSFNGDVFTARRKEDEPPKTAYDEPIPNVTDEAYIYIFAR